MSAPDPNAAVDLLVNIDVEDLEAAIRFYEQALGLRLKRRLFDATVAELGGAGVPLYLLQKEAGSRPTPASADVRSYRRHWTAVHFDVVVPALEPAIERAVRAGAHREGHVQEFPWGRQALMSDPFGNGFCFIQWLGNGYDAVTG